MTGAMDGLEHKMQNLQMASGSGRARQHDLEQYFIRQLRAATLQTPGLLEETPGGECLTVEDVMNKVEEYREAEKVGVPRRVCMNLAAAGLKALEGYHQMAMDACAEVEKQLKAESESLPQGGAWVAGFQGLIYACKGDWEAAAFYLSAVIQQVEQACVGSRFFHQFVFCLVAESLGYLMIHVIDPRVPAGCPQSSEISCEDRHAFYPFLLFGRRGESHTGSDVEFWMECANLPPETPEARRACVDAYHKAAKIFVESTSASRLRESLLAGLHMPDAPESMSLHISMPAGVRDSEFGQTLALTHSARALWSAVMKGEESVKVWALCENILKLAVVCHPRQPKPPGHADSVDVVCFALFVMILGKPGGGPNGEDDGWMQGLREKVTLHLSSNHQPPFIYPWIRHTCQVLVHIYKRAGDYSAAAEVCVLGLHSTLGDLPFSIKTQLRAAEYWGKAGDTRRWTAMVVKAESASQQLHESEWELRVRALLEAAKAWDKDGQTERPVRAWEEAWRLCSRRSSSNEFTYFQYYPTFAVGMRRLLHNYRELNNRPSAYELVDFMDAHVDKLLEVVDGCEGKQEDTEKRRVHWRAWRGWKMMTAFLSEDLGDLKQCKTILEGIKEALPGKDPLGTGDDPLFHVTEAMLMAVTADLHIRNGNWDRAVTKCEQALKALQKVSMKSGDVDSDLVKTLKNLEIGIRFKLCHSLEDSGQHVKCDAEVETLSQLDMTGVSGRTGNMTGNVNVQLLQAKAAMRRYHPAAFFTHIEEAQKLAANDPYGLGVVKFYEARGLAKQAQILRVQARIMRKQAAESTEIEVQRLIESVAESVEQEEQQKLKRAAELAGEAAVLAAAQQRETCYQDNKPTAWVLFFKRAMHEVHWLLQNLWISGFQNPERGLIWAERANARFLLHQIHTIKGEEEPLFNPEDLEKCDSLMANIIWATARSLSPNTAIIHYVYDPIKGIVYMYVIRQSGPRVFYSCTTFTLSTWFKGAGETRRTSLEALISEARTCILKKEDTKSSRPIKALVTLYALLVEPMEAYLKGCDTLVFVPGHGCLAQVPFAALYDGRKGKFLVQLQATKGVAVIPSITTLYRCLQRQVNWQEKFQSSMQDPVDVSFLDSVGSPEELLQQQPHREGSWQLSRVAFMAGNPEPMGLRWPQLDFSLQEAITVASFFNVQPCVGRNMTKKAVLDGLAHSGVVLLATHGMVDEDRGYPHGCLLIQRPDDSSETGGHGAESDRDRGHRSSHVFEVTDAESRLRRVQEAGQVLTASEIANLEGGISAGLVVLSTCESGLGEITGSEGQLGLGRALLQAGAATAVLTMWKVDDRQQMLLVVVLFHVLYVNPRTRGMNVCEALQYIMEVFITGHFPIQFWASLSVVGSPLLNLRPRPGSSAREASSHITTIYDTMWTPCATSCAVCDRHIRKLSTNSDEIGDFAWKGEIDPTTGKVKLHKLYLDSTVSIEYSARGTKSFKNGQHVIEGYWGDSPADNKFLLEVERTSYSRPWTELRAQGRVQKSKRQSSGQSSGESAKEQKSSELERPDSHPSLTTSQELPARSLSIVWGDDARYWKWTCREGSRHEEVAHLKQVCWLEVKGEMRCHLEPGRYTLSWRLHMVEGRLSGSYGWDVVGKPVRFQFETSHGDKGARIVEDLMLLYTHEGRHTGNGWRELDVGEFDISPESQRPLKITFSMSETGRHWKEGLFLDGVRLQKSSELERLDPHLLRK